MDADIQQSLSDHREEDLQKYPNSPLPWQMRNFAGMSSEEIASILVNLKKISCDIVIDCPGNIIDPNLKAIYTDLFHPNVQTLFDHHDMKILGELSF